MNSILFNTQFSCPNTCFILTTIIPCDSVDTAFIQTIVIGFLTTINCHYMVPIAIAFFVVNMIHDLYAASSYDYWTSSFHLPYPETR
jgi:hypothetical protein